MGNIPIIEMMRTLSFLWLLASCLGWYACQSVSDTHQTTPEKGKELEMAEAATAFLAVLPDSLKAQAQGAFSDSARLAWHFFPMERHGLSLRQMGAAPREKLFALLGIGLSAAGLEKTQTIMSLESVLHEMENRADDDFWRDPEGYNLSIFGQPGTEEPWSWRFEGHHVSLNYTSLEGGRVSATPNFLGSNPALVKEGAAKGREALQAEEEMGRALFFMLEVPQQTQAVIRDTAPREMVTFVDQRVQLDQFEGLPAAEMDASQQAALRSLIELYTGRAEGTFAAPYWARIDSAGFDKLYFGWAGGTEKGAPIYYRIHGPTLLIEYDNVQNGANHAHSVWRDPGRDFGYDWLMEHHQHAEDHSH